MKNGIKKLEVFLPDPFHKRKDIHFMTMEGECVRRCRAGDFDNAVACIHSVPFLRNGHTITGISVDFETQEVFVYHGEELSPMLLNHKSSH